MINFTGWRIVITRPWMLTLVLIIIVISAVFMAQNAYSQDRSQFSQDKCKKCHEDFDLKAFGTSKHAGIGCLGCHNDLRSLPHAEKLGEVKCERCHQKAYREFSKSIHGQALAKGIKEAPRCWNCHGAHDVHAKVDKESHTYPNKIPSTCGSAKCHSSPEMAKKFGIPMLNPFSNYSKSIHAKKLSSGNLESATCSKCHGGHDITTLNEPNSPINRDNVPKTCAKCHEDVYEEFTKSIHWIGYLKGIKKSPVCTDCHMEHEVLSHKDPKSAVSHEKVPALCTDCHDNTLLSQRYNIPLRTLSSYLKSFHGLALKSGNLRSADCTSCHAVHSIRKSNDPKSTVHPNNLQKTCGTCHPGVGIELKNAKVHTQAKESDLFGFKIVNSVKIVYIILILVSVGGMFAFCLLDLVAKTKRKRKVLQVGEDEAHSHGTGKHKYFMRFNRVERGLHFTIMITFITLVYTGFCRSFPDSILAYPMTKMMRHEVRDWLHRVAGVIITLDIIVQLILFAVTKRGREQLKAMLPNFKDMKDAIHLVKFNLGKVKTHPHFDRFSFMEKFEYWALLWGSIVMGVSGVALWFKDKTLSLFPYWIVDLASVLHFYEAVLASLAILIWHFYWIMFNPDVYPLDTKFITGKISEEHMILEHYNEWVKASQEPVQAEVPYVMSGATLEAHEKSRKKKKF